MKSLARTAIGGVAWNWAGSAVLVVAQIASTAATARLVAPREFGLYATAQAAAGFMGYFTMTAIGSGILRRPQLTKRTIGTALTLSLASSLLVAVALAAVAGLWARIWGAPDAVSVIRVIALNLLLMSAATVPLALLRHRLWFGRAALVETTTQVVGVSAGVVLAVELHSALALALGQAMGAGLLLVATAAMTWRQLRLSFDRTDARELAIFATQVNFIGLGSYATNTAPSWYAARMFGAVELGLYSRATLIIGLPQTYILFGITKVVYPLYGRVREDPRRLRALIGEGLSLTTGLIWPLFGLVAGAAPVVVDILLGPRWHGAASLVSLSALIGCGTIACGFLTNAAEALGWMRIVAARQVSFLVGTVLALVFARLEQWGLTVILVAVALAQWVTYAFTVVPFVRRRLLELRAVVLDTLANGALAMAAFGAGAGAAAGLREAPLALQAAAQIAIAIALAIGLFSARTRIPAMRVLVTRFGGRRSPETLQPSAVAR